MLILHVLVLYCGCYYMLCYVCVVCYMCICDVYCMGCYVMLYLYQPMCMFSYVMLLHGSLHYVMLFEFVVIVCVLWCVMFSVVVCYDMYGVCMVWVFRCRQCIAGVVYGVGMLVHVWLCIVVDVVWCCW